GLGGGGVGAAVGDSKGAAQRNGTRGGDRPAACAQTGRTARYINTGDGAVAGACSNRRAECCRIQERDCVVRIDPGKTNSARVRKGEEVCTDSRRTQVNPCAGCVAGAGTAPGNAERPRPAQGVYISTRGNGHIRIVGKGL